jgi:hypothetical protein
MADDLQPASGKRLKIDEVDEAEVVQPAGVENVL